MENEKFQVETDERLSKIEKELFDGDYHERYLSKSAREQAKEITEGKTKEHHIGKKSPEVLKQELDSHIQSYRETFTNDEKIAWNRKRQSLIDQLRDATK